MHHKAPLTLYIRPTLHIIFPLNTVPANAPPRTDSRRAAARLAGNHLLGIDRGPCEHYSGTHTPAGKSEAFCWTLHTVFSLRRSSSQRSAPPHDAHSQTPYRKPREASARLKNWIYSPLNPDRFQSLILEKNHGFYHQTENTKGDRWAGPPRGHTSGHLEGQKKKINQPTAVLGGNCHKCAENTLPLPLLSLLYSLPLLALLIS